MWICGLFFAKLLLAAAPPEVLLWPDGAPGSEGQTAAEVTLPAREDGLRRIASIHKPSITAHLPAKDKATGAAVLILPGGGHRYLSIDNEGHDIARWLAERGVAGLVVKYRVAWEDGSPYRVEEHAVADAVRAVRVARARAKEWGLDPERIGMMGLSAGGQLVFHAATRESAGNADSKDSVERESSRPAFAAYVYSGSPLAETEIPKDVPPAFLCVASDDKGPAKNALDIYQKLRDAGGSVELHAFAHGGHGFGMKDRPLPITSWIVRFHEWMADQGFLKAGTTP